jgi:3-carboxy-cis,cis-muconate cycloisomerase
MSESLDSGLLSPVRAGTPVDPVVADSAWVRAMLEAEAALARAQARLGTVPDSAAGTITALALSKDLDVASLARAARETANPVVGLVAAFAAAVAEVDPSAAEYVHRGSTSQDVFDTAAMLIAARAIEVTLADLDRCLDALAALAARHRNTPMIGRTLGQHAVPTTFGLKAAGWLQLVGQARQRLAELRRSGLPAQLGGAAGTLAGYLEYAGSEADLTAYTGELLAAFAAEVGLSQPLIPWHVLRTPIADVGSASAFVTVALGKIAADVQIMTMTEVGELAEPGRQGRGASSAMPHKRNPVLSTLLRSAALQAPQLAATLLQCVVSENERSAGGWQAEWQPMRECLRLAGGAAATAAELLEGLTVRPEQMLENLHRTGEAVVSERVVAALAPALGRSRSRSLVDAAVGTANAGGRSLAEILAAQQEVSAVLSRIELDRLLDPVSYLGAAGPLVDRMLGSLGQ